MNDPLFSIEQAAVHLGGISIWTVRAWLSQGKMKRTKVGGRTMIRQSELERIAVDQQYSTPPTALHVVVDGMREPRVVR